MYTSRVYYIQMKTLFLHCVNAPQSNTLFFAALRNISVTTQHGTKYFDFITFLVLTFTLQCRSMWLMHCNANWVQCRMHFKQCTALALHRSWDEAKVGCNAVHYIQGAFVELRWGGGDSWVRRRPLCSDPLNLRAVPQRVSHPDDTTPVQKGQTLVLWQYYGVS